MDNKKINKAINSLPVNNDCRRKVKELIKALHPEYEPTPKRQPKPGEVWSWDGEARFIIMTNSGELVSVDERGFQIAKEWKNSWAYYKFKASSLEEYYKEKL